MENITMGHIYDDVVFLVALFGGLFAIYKGINKAITKMLDEKFKAIDKSIAEVETRLDSLDVETTKSFLVRFLADVERGSAISEIERQRFWEMYEHYKSKNGNSYISDWVEKEKKKGWL